MQILKKLIALMVICLAPSIAYSKTLKIGMAGEPSSIDPHYHNVGPNNMFSTNVFSMLVAQDENQQTIPDLASSWKPINDTTWEFKLRKDVQWHDGSKFTADDVIFTASRALNVPKSPASFGIYLKGKTFIKIDDYTVHVKTEKPYPLMANDLSVIKIVSKKHGTNATTEDYNSGKAAIGTGPYKLKQYIKGDKIILEKNPNYHGKKPEYDTVEIKPIKSGPARVAALLSGDVDFIDGVPPVDVKKLEKNKKVQLSNGLSNRVIYLHIDQFREDSPFVKANGGGKIKNPLLDVRVRKAISLAINRQAMVDKVMEGLAVPAGQLLPKGFHGVSPNMKPDPYDVNAAKKLMKEAGYEKGFELTIHGPNDRYINDAKIAEALGQMLSRIGIKCKVETMPKAVYFSRASAGGPNKTPEFSMMVLGWGAGSGEASSPLKSLLATYDKSKGMGGANRGRHSDPKVDALIEKALATVDSAARGKILAEATEIAVGKNYGIIPIHYQLNTWASKAGYSYLPRTDEYTLVTGFQKK